MGRKVFQIGFVLLVMAAFGTVFNHYLKNKISDPADYLKYIESFPETRISIIDPIIIKLPSEFDKTDYLLNTPINTKIIQFDPEVKGTTYWSDQRTLEFYPDNPLLSNSEYMVKVDINKIYQVNSKVKYFRFKLNTYKQVLFVNKGAFEPIDSSLRRQIYKGSIVFNDFIDFDDVNDLFTAEQDGMNLNIAFKPGKLKDSYLFIVEDIKRKNTPDTLLLRWNGKAIGLNLKGNKQIIIPSLNNFEITDSELTIDTILRLKIGFSDPLKIDQNFDSLIVIRGAEVFDFSCENQYLTFLFKDSLVDKIHLSIDKNLKNIIGIPLQNDFAKIVDLEKDVPALRISDTTFIISEFSENFHWQFEALKLKEVNIQIYKIFANNVLQFLQTNDIQGINQIDRVGSIVYENSISLKNQLQYNPEKWTQYQININDFEPEEGCIYSVLLGFNSKQTTLPCNKTDEDDEDDEGDNNNWQKFTDDYYDVNGDSINDPCSKQFYGFHRGIHHNLYFTKLGILTKQISNDSLYVWVSDINNAEPSKKVNIRVLNYQQQLIAKGESDNSGMVRFKLYGKPSFIIAQQGKNTTYLKLNADNKRFDSKGEAFFLKQREYWSPGDTMHFSFIHNASISPLPNSLLVLNLFSGNKKKIYTEIKPVNKQNQYLFKYFIPKGATIGKYKAEVSINNLKFGETFEILPPYSQRIDIDLNLMNETDVFYQYEIAVKNIQSFASRLNYSVNVYSEYEKNSIKNFKNFEFGDSEDRINKANFVGELDNNGKASLKIDKKFSNSSVKVTHVFYIRVINENLGFNEALKSFSNIQNKPVIGINTSNKIQSTNLFYCDSVIEFKFLLLNKNFQVNKKKTNGTVSLYKLNSNSKFMLQKSEILQFNKGTCNWSIMLNFPNQGKYKLVVKTNTDSAIAEKHFEIKWPDIYSNNVNFSQLNHMVFNYQNDSLYISDSLNVELNSVSQGSVLFVVENQNGVNFTKWFKVSKGLNNFKLPVYENFYPTAEIFTSLYYPNSPPIINNKTIKVKRRTKDLNPVIYGLNEVEAGKTITVTIKEGNNNALNYILTVNPASPYNNEELDNIDLFNYANNNYTIISDDVFGGSYISNNVVGDLRHNIFKKIINNSPFYPFSYQIGPFNIQAGESNIHEITMPQYIGDVDVCLIASDINNREFKEAVHKVSVKKSFVILTSAPDVISPNEEFYLPLNVYSSRKESGVAKIELLNSIDLNVIDELEKIVLVNHLIADTTNFKLKSKRRTGIGSIEIVAKDSNFSELHTVKIPIRSNVLLENHHIAKELNKQETWQTRFTPIGIKGTNSASIEYSEYANIHLSQLLLKMLDNLNPDIEHLISSAFPLMFFNELTDLKEGLKAQLHNKVQEALNKLIYYQLPSGGFSYWLNQNIEQDWCSTYAGYFMIEAHKQGYKINQAVYNKWLRYQRKKCLTWNYTTENSDLEQAFGLYALTLAEKPDVNSMLKLKNKQLSKTAALQLSMAFSVFGENKISNQLLTSKVLEYSYINDNTLGNPLRNVAIEFESYRQVNNSEKLDSIKSELEKLIVNPDYQSLQGIAFSIIGLAKFYQQAKDRTVKEISYTINRGKQEFHRSEKPYGVVRIPLEFTLAKTIDVNNNSKDKIMVSIDYAGRPIEISKTTSNQYIKGRFNFINSAGDIIKNGKVGINDQLNAEIKIFPLKEKLYSNYMVLVFPVANCFNFISFLNSNNQNIEYIHHNKNTVFYYFTLPKNGIEFSIPLMTAHKGKFHQPPVQIYSLYNPMIKTILKGNEFEVK